MALTAGVGRCEEASILSTQAYIPCNAPAERMVSLRSEGPYRMCAPCAHHNVRNRGGTDLGPYEGPPAEAVKGGVMPPAAKIVTATSSTPTADDLSEYAADAAAPVNAENILAAITRTARELRDAQEQVAQLEEELKAAQGRVRTIEEGTLPGLMDEAGQKLLVTVDSYELRRDEVLRASIPPANMPQAMMWLRGQNQGAIIKREMKLEFGKGEEQRAAEALDTITGAGFAPTDKQYVHPQTLGAAVREMLEAGVDVPMDLLGVFIKPIVRMKKLKR